MPYDRTKRTIAQALLDAACEDESVEYSGLVRMATGTMLAEGGEGERGRSAAGAVAAACSAVAVDGGGIRFHRIRIDRGGGYWYAWPFRTHSDESLVVVACLRAPPGADVHRLLRGIAAALRYQLDSAATAPVRRTAFPLAGVILVDVGAHGHVIRHVSRDFCDFTGYEPDQAVGRNPRFLQAKDRDQAGRWRLSGALERGEACTATLRNYRRDGRCFDNRVALIPVCDSDGRIDAWAGLLFDVDAEPVAPVLESGLGEFVHGLERSPLGRIVIDRADHRVRFANPVAATLFCCVPRTMLGRRLVALSPALDPGPDRTPVAVVSKPSEVVGGCGAAPSLILDRRDASGSPRARQWADDPAALLLDGPVRLPRTDSAAQGCGAEMTVRAAGWGRRAAWLITLIDLSGAPWRSPMSGTGAIGKSRERRPVLSSRPDGTVVDASESVAELLGYSRAELMTRSPVDLDVGILADADAWTRSWALMRVQRFVSVETRLRHRDGRTLPAILDVRYEVVAGEERQVVHVRSVSGR